MAVRRAKLVCTIGPASVGSDTVLALVNAGMDVARVNFSHGDAADHELALSRVREASREAGRTVAALADLSGPKVRLGELRGGAIHLKPGDRFVLRTDDGEGDGIGDETGASTTHAGLGGDVEPGDRVLLADGAVELVVIRSGDEVVTEVVKVIRGGRVGNRAGVNAPAEKLSLPSITDKDRADLRRALDMGFDLVAQSFVRSAADVEELRSLMGPHPVPIVAKIETRNAVDSAAEVAQAADALMVARGDLGVEIPLEEIPVVQKELLMLCRRSGTPAIVATQMLESMLTSSRPTRAEVSDVANAVLDGADAVMLSGETAVGQFPVEAAEAAAEVVRIAEDRGRDFRLPGPAQAPGDEARAIARAAREVCEVHPVTALACFTRTGRTATVLAAERPSVPIFAFASDASLSRALALVWGVTPLVAEEPSDVDGLIAMIDRRLVEEELMAPGSVVVLVAAAPVGKAHTNLLKLHRLGAPAGTDL